MDIELSILNAQSGREDRYLVTLSKKQLTFGQGKHVAICTGIDDENPEWENAERPKSILKRDDICPPAGFAKMLMRAWLAWRDGDLNDDTVVEELLSLTDWLNTITRTKPRSEFWRRNI